LDQVVEFPDKKLEAAVRIGDSFTGRWRFIDKTGSVVINLSDEVTNVSPFSEGLAAVLIGDLLEGGKWGWIDRYGFIAR